MTPCRHWFLQGRSSSTYGAMKMNAESECVKDLTTGARVVHLIKENRLEAMIVTILLYSTGMLEKAVSYGTGVC